MRKRLVACLGLLLACGWQVSEATASGFMVPELSASGMGKGSAIVADYDDPALIWYNPAGTAFLPAASFSGGVLFAIGHTDFKPAGGGDTIGTIDKLYELPRIYADVALVDWMHLGLGFYTAYGMGVKYDNDWLGREDGISSEMTTVSLNPNLSFKVHPQVGIGFGFVAMKAASELVNGLPEAVGGDVKFGGEGWAFGGTAGVTIKAIPGVLDFGLSYRSRMVLSMDGRVDFDPHPDFASSLLDQKASAEITTPDYITGGVAWNALPNLRIALDCNYIIWSVYDKLMLKMDDGTEQGNSYNYKNSVIIRLGAEWRPESVDGLALRGGFIWDQNPGTDGNVGPTMPDSDKLNFTVGLGYKFGWFRADASYMLNVYLDHDVKGVAFSPEGNYGGLAHMAGVSLTAFIPGESETSNAETK